MAISMPSVFGLVLNSAPFIAPLAAPCWTWLMLGNS